jgi:hypothetical protein
MIKVFKCLLIFLIPVAGFSAELVLSAPPKLPNFMNHTVRVDPARMQKMAQDYQTAKGKDATAEDFMFAAMPEQIFKSILYEGIDLKEMPSDLGLLYWSGFQGGVWLNSIMKSDQGRGVGPAGMIRAFKIPALLYINNMCKQRLDLITRGSRRQKADALDKSLGSLISSYGYNRGYLLEIMKHPPQGYTVPDDFFVCKGLIDCKYGPGDIYNLQALLLPPREQLNNPTQPYWIDFKKRFSEKLPKAMDQGKGVWKNIMADKEFSAGSYQALLDISAEFLMINETVMLAAVTAVATIDEQGMDRVLMADAAFRVWLIGYMAGLGERAD